MAAGLALFMIAVALAPSVAPAADDPPQLRRDGRWMVDDLGRVVLLHGVNAVWKLDPYYPPATAEGFTEADADWLVEQGFNTVRLGVLFVGVMPEPGVIDHAYLSASDRVIQMLADRGIWVQIDFHQDMYNERFGGEGFPDWAVYDLGLPMIGDAGFPGNYFQAPTSRAFQAFFENEGGVLDYYAQAWQAVAAKWKNQPYLMGYDLMNEPWPGQHWPACANPGGCPVFDTQYLQPYHEKVLGAIRAVDPDNIVWIEPTLMFDFGAQDHQGLLGGFDDDNLGFSWHNYCLSAGLIHAQGFEGGADCPELERLVFDNAEERVATLGAATLMSEFGASEDLPDIATVTALADEYLTSWQYWHYKNWRDPTTESQESGAQGLFDDDEDLDSVREAKLKLLARTYPRATAGVPEKMTFDPATAVFEYWYRPREAAGPTEIAVPAVHYPAGYSVQVRGADVVSAPGAPVVLLEETDDVLVKLRIAPLAG